MVTRPRKVVIDERSRNAAVEEMFTFRNKREQMMKTETPRGKLDAFVMMDVVEYGLSMPKLTRKPDNNTGKDKLVMTPRRRLSDVFKESHDTRMVGYARKGRVEMEKIYSTQARNGEDIDELLV